jgi:hypothetical protein
MPASPNFIGNPAYNLHLAIYKLCGLCYKSPFVFRTDTPDAGRKDHKLEQFRKTGE